MPFVGPSLPLSSRTASTERAVNLVPVPVESPNAARKVAYRDLPGLVLKAELDGAIRGALRSNGRSFVAAGVTVLELSGGFTTTMRGTINGAGWADFAHNQTQIAVTSGGALYVMERGGATFALVPNYPGGSRIAVLNEYLICTEPGSGRFFWSEVGDANTLPALSFATAESSPDDVVCPVVSNEEVVLFGLAGSEVWRVVGGEEVFARRAIIEVGCKSPFTPRNLDNSIFWVGYSEVTGQVSVYRLNGYTAQRIATDWVEDRLAAVDLANAYGLAMHYKGRAQYWLKCPELDTTMIYDVKSGLWFEGAELFDGDYASHRADVHLFHNDTHIVGDSAGKLYELTEEANDNAGDPLCRSRVMANITHPTGRLLRFAELECICDKATGGTLLLRWSDDNGANFGNWHQISLGATGNYRARVRKLALGSSRNRVFELRVTDDVPWNPADVILRTV